MHYRTCCLLLDLLPTIVKCTIAALVGQLNIFNLLECDFLKMIFVLFFTLEFISEPDSAEPSLSRNLAALILPRSAQEERKELSTYITCLCFS